MSHHVILYVFQFFNGIRYFLTVESNRFPGSLKAPGGTNKELQFQQETIEETSLRELREEGDDKRIEIGRFVFVAEKLVSDDHKQVALLLFDVKNLQGLDEVRYIEERDERGYLKEKLKTRWVAETEFEAHMHPGQVSFYRKLRRMTEMR